MKTLYTFLLVGFTSFSAIAQHSIQKILYHQFGKPDLIETSQNEVEQLIQELKEVKVETVKIKSHTDKVGTEPYNQKLSQQRNFLVLQILQGQLPKDVSFDVSYFGEDSLLTSDDWSQPKNRRTEIYVWYGKKDESKQMEITQLSPYIEDVKEQRFEINLDDTVSITANEGTFMKFPPGSFQNKRKEAAKGKAVLLIKEYYMPGDILLSGMHSVSDKGLLQTGGMFKVFIVQDNDTMVAETQKPVQIKMPDINNISANMNVFTTNHSDTSLWNDTRQGFRRIISSWSWPLPSGKLQDLDIDEELPFYKWEIGRKWSEEYCSGNPIIYWGSMNKFVQTNNIKPLAKTVSYTITKTDSITLKVDMHETFRRRAYKKYLTKEFDTTFLVKYSSAVYETIITDLNYINCDRFLKFPKVTDFYVKTPDFVGAQLLVYFKNLNAFMPAEYENDKYKVLKVPPGEDVYLIAVGKRGDEFYFGKQPFTISQNGVANVSMKKIKYEDMKKMFKEFGYKTNPI